MSNVIFEPWIGSKYNSENRFGVRVLVLGESHYGDESETRSTITSEVVRWLAQDERHSFFTKISKVLLGLDEKTWLDNEVRGEVWNHIAFYNYIQGFVGNESRVRPSSEMWDSAKEPFLETVKRLSPMVILVLGKELATRIPKLPDDIEVCCIQHPSTGFVYSQWNPLFIQAVQNAKQNTQNVEIGRAHV